MCQTHVTWCQRKSELWEMGRNSLNTPIDMVMPSFARSSRGSTEHWGSLLRQKLSGKTTRRCKAVKKPRMSLSNLVTCDLRLSLG